MKHLIILVGVICLALPTCAPAPEPEPEAAPEPVFDQAAEETAIRKVVEQVYAALNTQDVKSFVALYDENFSDWGGSIKGRSAWEKYISEYFDRQKLLSSKW